MLNPIALAVPVFFVSIGVELALAKRRGADVYRFTDTVTDLSCGITSQLVLLAWATLQLGIYSWVLEHFAVIRAWPAPWLPWAIAFVGVDFLYYWWHRLSHEVNVLWAAHVVHHQSEDYNLAVALRQAVLTSWTVLPFYLPLAVLGVPTVVYATMVAISTLYQFWIHTQLVGRITGPLDWVLNLPHHHRVHHAINPQYLDKNYGAISIVWDRIFGTYADEVEAPVYGITKPLASFDPMWAQVHYWIEMARTSRMTRRPADKLRAWLASPAWKPPELAAEASAPVELAARAKYERPLTPRLRGWIGVNFGLVVLATFSIMMWHGEMPRALLVLASLAVLAALSSFGALFEGRRSGKLLGGASFVLAIAAVAAGVSGCRRHKGEPRVVELTTESAVLPRVEPPPEAKVAGTRVHHAVLRVGDLDRRYLVVEPEAPLPGKRYPLVLVFHGDGGEMVGFHAAWPFEQATRADAYLAYPDGIGFTWDLETKVRNREVAFIEALVSHLAGTLPIDTSRVFGAGYSSGGFLVNVIACQSSSLFRAIASNAGGAPYKQAIVWPNGFTRCPGQAPVATLALHGSLDFGVTPDSGRFSAAYWAYINGCSTDEMETTGYPECRAYRGCPAGKAVAYCEIPTLGHWVWDRAALASWTFFQRQ